MRQSEWDDGLAQIQADVNVLTSTLTQAVERCREWCGPRLSGGGSEGSRGHTASSNVESQALSGQRDEFGRRLAHASEDLTMVRLGLGRLVKFVNAVTPVPAMSDAGEGCVSCKRIGVWSPVARQVRPGQQGPGRPAADAEPPVPLCSWCAEYWDWERRESEKRGEAVPQGKMPHPTLVERHALGKRISEQDIARARGA